MTRTIAITEIDKPFDCSLLNFGIDPLVQRAIVLAYCAVELVDLILGHILQSQVDNITPLDAGSTPNHDVHSILVGQLIERKNSAP